MFSIYIKYDSPSNAIEWMYFSNLKPRSHAWESNGIHRSEITSQGEHEVTNRDSSMLIKQFSQSYWLKDDALLTTRGKKNQDWLVIDFVKSRS